MSKRSIAIGLALLLAMLAGASLLPALRAYWWNRESTQVRRGAAIAARVGCIACHGPDGTRGLRDPKTGQEIPTWDGGVPMMYVNGPEEVREYILDGISKRRAASASAIAERERSAIRMPAYRDVLKPREVEDLVAYFMSTSRMRSIADDEVSGGRDLAQQHGCETCHGVGGAGGVLNPGSFKGYIPGWLGADFEDLARDDEELREWILTGTVERLLDDRIARYFLQRQRLQMPAYRASLSPQQTDALVAYIHWLRAER